jgi:hypothetical protein
MAASVAAASAPESTAGAACGPSSDRTSASRSIASSKPTPAELATLSVLSAPISAADAGAGSGAGAAAAAA